MEPPRRRQPPPPLPRHDPASERPPADGAALEGRLLVELASITDKFTEVNAALVRQQDALLRLKRHVDEPKRERLPTGEFLISEEIDKTIARMRDELTETKRQLEEERAHNRKRQEEIAERERQLVTDLRMRREQEQAREDEERKAAQARVDVELNERLKKDREFRWRLYQIILTILGFIGAYYFGTRAPPVPAPQSGPQSEIRP